jgi:zinc protease
MKKILQHIILLAVSVFPLHLLAQMGEPYEMKINDVKVIVHPSGNDIVEIRTIIQGGVQNYPADKAGIESLAMTALTECGTLKDDKNSFKNKLDKASAQMNGSTDMDYATIRMNCIKSDFEPVWQLYTEAMTIPKFDTKEFERIRQDAITALRANESNPDFAIRRMAHQVAFAGKNYAKHPQGTIEILGKLSIEETKRYYKTIFSRDRLLIVVVGDIDKNNLQQKIQNFLTKVPAGQQFVAKKESYVPPSNSLKYEEKEFATNYIQGITSAPEPGSPDYDAFILAMRIFYNRHFIDIRSKNGLSYAPATWFSGGLTPYASIYVTTTEPNKYIVVARQLIDKIKKEGFTEEELKNMKTVYVTQTYYQQETNSALAAAIASNEVINGNWKRAYTIKDDMKKVTLSDVNRVFNKYINNITWAYQGNPKKVEAKMFTQKELPQMPQEIKPMPQEAKPL